LENYDAVGLWRDEIQRKTDGKFRTLSVKASDILPDGHKLDGVDSLKNYLANQRKDEFARSLVTRLTTYALGRRPELSDDATINELTTHFATNEYRIRGLIHSIVASELFLTK
jgi:hypothetical protein